MAKRCTAVLVWMLLFTWPVALSGDDPKPAEEPAASSEETPAPGDADIGEAPSADETAPPEEPPADTEPADAPAEDVPAENVPAEEPAAVEPATEEPPSEKPAADPSAKYELKYKFTPGETVRTEVVHRATVQTSIQGTTQKADTQSRSIKVWQIDGVDPKGSATFSHTVEHIDMWQRSSGRNEVRYNSDDGSEVPPGYEEVAKSVGAPLSVITMDVRGKILKRKETREQPIAMSTQMTMPLPPGPIAMGETWSSPGEVDVAQKDGTPKKLKTRQKFTLESVEGNIATVKVDAQVLSPVTDPAIEAQLIQRLSSGTVRFDMDAGRVLSQVLELDKHVIGFSGPASSMHYVTRLTETLLPPGEPKKVEKAKAETARRAPAKKR